MIDASATTLRIRTPEGVVFSLPLAGPVTRCLAWLFDFLIVMIMIIGATWMIGLLTALTGGAAFVAMGVAMIAIPVCYGMVFEWIWRGQTIGKKLLKLRVIDSRGLSLSAEQIVVRNLLRAVDSLPLFYAVGGAVCALSPRCQRLGDMAAGTVVIRAIKEEIPVIEGVLKGKFNSFRDHPHIEARLRQRVSPSQAHAALSAVIRRDAIEPNARLRLFSSMADSFRAAAPFPEDAVHGLTDEQYVRNVIDSIFRGRGGQ